MHLAPRLRSPWAGVAVTVVSTVLLTSALAPVQDEVGLLNERFKRRGLDLKRSLADDLMATVPNLDVHLVGEVSSAA